MGKLKLAMNLIKLNNKLGLLDAGDVVNLASTAYKVKNFSPMGAIDDFDLDYYLHREEYEKAQRRNTILVAAALGAGTYLLVKNRDQVADGLNKALEAGKDVAADVKEKGEEVASEAVDKGKELADDAADKADDLKDDAKDLAKDAKKDAKDLAEDAKDKAEDVIDK